MGDVVVLVVCDLGPLSLLLLCVYNNVSAASNLGSDGSNTCYMVCLFLF